MPHLDFRQEEFPKINQYEQMDRSVPKTQKALGLGLELGQDGDAAGRVGKYPGGGFSNHLRGERPIDGWQAAVGIGRVAEEEVDGDVLGDGWGGLLLDSQSAEDGGPDAVEDGSGNTGGGDFGNFAVEFGAGHFDLIGGGGHVKGEKAGIKAEELGGTDLIGQAEFLADAGKQWPGHVRRIFLNHRQCITVGTADARTRKPDG